jgi:hypothetical protein
MKGILFISAFAFCAQLGAQTPQPLKGTISNLSDEPAPYVPDDSLPFAASAGDGWPDWPGSPARQGQLNAPMLFVPVAIAPVYDPGFLGGGYSRGFHPRPATPPATITGRPFGPGTHHSGGRRR